MVRPRLPWAQDRRLGNSVSNPCLIEGSESWRLYYSASLVWLDDSGFCEPRYIAMVAVITLSHSR